MMFSRRGFAAVCSPYLYLYGNRNFFRFSETSGTRRRTGPRFRPGRSQAGDRGDLRSRLQNARPARASGTGSIPRRCARRQGAAFRECRRVGHSRRHQYFRIYWRVNQALGTKTLVELAERVQALVKPEIPTTLMEKMKKLPDLMKLGSFPPKSVRSGICQQVVLEGDKADLNRLADHSMLAAGRRSRQRASFRLGGEREAPLNAAPADISRLAASSRATPRPATATSACTASSNSARENVRCTGTCTTTVPGIFGCIKSGRENAAGDRAGRRKRAALRRHRPAAAGD